MRIEWAKSKARAERWEEEIKLLREEMRRVIEYFSWKAQWWRVQGPRRTDADGYICNGAAAYAAKQAAMFENMAKSFVEVWYPYVMSKGLFVPWPDKYLPTAQQVLPMSDIDVD
jgi:hypothetical protein